MNTMTKTIAVVTMVSLRVGHVTREISWRTSSMNFVGLVFAITYLHSDNFGTQIYMALVAAGFQNAVLAGVEGLEPPTPGFGDRCSTS